MSRTVELVFFEGCPNVSAARTNLHEALEASGLPTGWSEWDLLSDDTPDRVSGYASPTILVDGKDVTGVGRQNTALACRTGPVPSPSAILRALNK